MEQVPVTYDTYGRMKFHSDYHGREKTPWTTSDEKFLIENYAKIGPEQVSFALERTIHTIMTRAYELRKSGRMDKPIKARFGGQAVWKRRKILVLQKSASQNARYAVFSVLGMVILPTNILRFGVFTQPGAEADGAIGVLDTPEP